MSFIKSKKSFIPLVLILSYLIANPWRMSVVKLFSFSLPLAAFLVNNIFYFALFICLFLYNSSEKILNPLMKSIITTLIYYVFVRLSFVLSFNLTFALIFEIITPILLVFLIFSMKPKQIKYNKLLYFLLIALLIINTAVNILYYVYSKISIQNFTENFDSTLLSFLDLLTLSNSIFPVILNILKYLMIILILLFPTINKNKEEI